MSNAASRAQAVFNRIKQHQFYGLTFDELCDDMEGSGVYPAQLLDALAKLHRDGVVSSGNERPRRFRVVHPQHPNYYEPEERANAKE